MTAIACCAALHRTRKPASNRASKQESQTMWSACTCPHATQRRKDTTDNPPSLDGKTKTQRYSQQRLTPSRISLDGNLLQNMRDRIQPTQAMTRQQKNRAKRQAPRSTRWHNQISQQTRNNARTCSSVSKTPRAPGGDALAQHGVEAKASSVKQVGGGCAEQRKPYVCLTPFDPAAPLLLQGRRRLLR